MTKIIIFFVLLFFSPQMVLAKLSDFEKNCKKEDISYPQRIDEIKEGYYFGKQIIQILNEKNLIKLYELIDGELDSGPRRTYALKTQFDDIFDKEWIDEILKQKLPCSPVGWRGYMLGNGNVWFDKYKTGWKIRSIIGAKQEKLESLPEKWSFNNITISPLCFTKIWMSRDNFEEFFSYFKLKNINKFINEPGQYYGKEINYFYPIKPSWCSKDDCTTISLVTNLDTCTSSEIKTNEVKKNGIRYKYKLIKKVSTSNCQKLAKNLKQTCQQSYLLWVGTNSGGTIGWHSSVGIYGIFEKEDNKLIFPLKFFKNQNEALNFLDN